MRNHTHQIGNVTAYPLQWPLGWKRTSRPARSRFKAMAFGRVRDELISQLRKMGATNVVLSTNVPLKNDGMPYATFASFPDKGVAVYFFYKKKQMVFACDKWDRLEDNMKAINNTIESIRGIERWGASEMLERAFNGFAQLEAPSEGLDQANVSMKARRTWKEVLNVSDIDLQVHQKSFQVAELLKFKHRTLVKKFHEGGETPDAEELKMVNVAYQEATEWAKNL